MQEIALQKVVLMALVLGALVLSPALPARAGAAETVASAATVASAKGAIAGKVLDAQKLPLPGVTVTLHGSTLKLPLTVYTEIDGGFRFTGLVPGEYQVNTKLEGFQPMDAKLNLVAGQELELDVRMAPATFAETVEVKAEAEKVGAVAILDERRQAAVVTDAISAQEIAATPDSDAAGVVERLTGITLVSDKYVFVRGLGERYSSTTLNGAALASTETEKRVVPLDLFPAKLLDSIEVVKTYTPDRPGSFGSGVVELSTISFPTTTQLKLTLGAGYNSSTTDEEFQRYAGGLSFSGDGGQPIPAAFPKRPITPQSRFDPDGFTPEQLQTFGRALGASWTGDRPRSSPLNRNLNLTYGNTVGRFGFVFSGVHAHSRDLREESQRYFGVDAGNVLVPTNEYTLKTNSEGVREGLVGAISMRLGDGHRLQLSSMFSRDANASSRTQEGYQAAATSDIRDYRVRYEREDLITTKLSGEHFFAGLLQGASLDWSYSRSTGTRTSDQRENLYRKAADGTYHLLTGYAEVGRIEYFDLDDTVDGADLTLTGFYSIDDQRYGSVKIGGAHTARDRTFSARRLRFITENPNQFDLTLLPEQIFTAANIRPGGFEIRETTGVNDAYSGDHTISAAFLMADATFGRWRMVGGARIEESEQRVTTFNPFATDEPSVAINDDRDWLPALNLIYAFSTRTNFRFAASRTINRPEFRELSPYSFVEVTGGRSIAGNPDLKQATLDAADLRWETFPQPGEVIAVSAFYKRIHNPIERYVQATSELRTSWINAETAVLRGVELEFRRSLAAFSPALRAWSVNMNFSYVDSDVTIPKTALSVITNNNRTLQGQAKYSGNLALQLQLPSSGTLIRAIYNYTGKRLSDVGAYDLPDIYEDSRAALDLLISQSLSGLLRGLEIKLTGTNLLDAENRFTQGEELQRGYFNDRGFGLSLGYTY